MNSNNTPVHINFDNAWEFNSADCRTISCVDWGRKLRFCTTPRVVSQFQAFIGKITLPPFLIYGSGDFHHLTALWIQNFRRDITVISFDNHPDWDIRPPKWCCGSWVNRALDLSFVQQIAIWGCGNFECWGWHRITGNHRDVRSGRLKVFPWADNRSETDQTRPHSITKQNWRAKFSKFVESIGKRTSYYVTIDMDCLNPSEAITNWENGFYSTDDIIWALQMLKTRGQIIGGDICGAYSIPNYARWTQKFASEMDHPKMKVPSIAECRRINEKSLAKLLPELISLKNEAVGEQEQAESLKKKTQDTLLTQLVARPV